MEVRISKGISAGGDILIVLVTVTATVILTVLAGGRYASGFCVRSVLPICSDYMSVLDDLCAYSRRLSIAGGYVSAAFDLRDGVGVDETVQLVGCHWCHTHSAFGFSFAHPCRNVLHPAGH